MQNNPKTFISYAWESDEAKAWIKLLATRLRGDGVDAKIDQWEVVPGDQMPHFMEKSVRDNDYVLIICTPKYKVKSDGRQGGVGYEGDIMTAEVLQTSNQRKFIPILRYGTASTAIPTWLQGKYYIDFTTNILFERNFEDLLATLFHNRETAPQLGKVPTRFQNPLNEKKEGTEEAIKIVGVLVDEVSQPRNDGTRGSALYQIPFELSKRPDHEWIDLFIASWNRPPRFTTMHRPGIASVVGNRIVLSGTTIEEVEKYHKDTLKLAVGVANSQWKEIQDYREQQKEQERKRQEDHRRNIDEISGRIKFD